MKTYVDTPVAPHSPKSVVIVDDNTTARALLRHHLNKDPRLRIVGEVATALEARKVIAKMRPDVITLDVELPGMNGLDFLRDLMQSMPVSVVMVSSFTRRGSDIAIKALSLGAIDCLSKAEVTADAISLSISERVFSATQARVQRKERRDQTIHGRQQRRNYSRFMPLVVIGSSTGGVVALEQIVSNLDPNGAPIVIVQHMPTQFLSSFSNRLNRQFPRSIKLVEPGKALRWGDIRFAPSDGMHTIVSRNDGEWRCQFIEGNTSDLHCPSVDQLFFSAAEYGQSVISALLTGLGKDGAEGMKALKDNGARTLAQDEHSCVIYGMPRAARLLGGVERELPIEDIGPVIDHLTDAYKAGKKGIS